MKRILKKFWSITSTVLVAAMVLCAVILVGARVLGYQAFTVISGSMEPTYSVGDLLYVKEKPIEDIKIGDPLTFVLNEDLVVATHRVVGVDTEAQCFYTKGDANEVADSAGVHFNNVIGVPRFCIPALGYVANFVQQSPGRYITLVAGIALVAAVFVPDIVRGARRLRNGEETEEQVEAE